MNVQPGDTVELATRTAFVLVTVVRINHKSITVRLPSGETRRVRPHQLGPPSGRQLPLGSEPSPPPEELPPNVIVFPRHSCGLGRRVWFYGPADLRVEGTIIALDRVGVRVRTDDGVAQSWRVRHERIHAIHTEPVPPRPESEILTEIARCHARLQPAWLNGGSSGPQERKARRKMLEDHLGKLFRELGREVEEAESLRWALRHKGAPT